MSTATSQGRSNRTTPATSSATTSVPKRCAIYVRKSTAKGLERDFNSCDAQRAACAAYIERQADWHVVDDTYEDGGFTGANVDRPAFQRLLADIDAGKIDVVLVYKVDRLSRSLLDFAKIMDRFARGNVAFVSITQNFSTADAMGRLLLNMLMSFAEFERGMIAERTRDKIAASRRRGKWTGGPVPFGYDVAVGRLVVNEFEAIVVREMFATYELRHSILAVLEELTEKARSRKVRSAGRVASGWTTAAVLNVLRDARYAGLMPYRDELHVGEQPAIVDGALFDRVQRMLRCGARVMTARLVTHLIQGLPVCARCGYAMVIVTTRKKGSAYSYVRCSSRDRKGPSACPTRPLPLAPVTDVVLARLREVAREFADEEVILAELRRRVSGVRDALALERGVLATNAGDAAAQLGRWVQTLESLSGLARSAAEGRLEEIGRAHERWTRRLREIDEEIAALISREVEAAWVTKTLRDFDGLWDAMTEANRRRLLQALVEKIVIDEPKGEVAVHLFDVATLAETSAPGLRGPVEVGEASA